MTFLMHAANALGGTSRAVFMQVNAEASSGTIHGNVQESDVQHNIDDNGSGVSAAQRSLI